MEPLTIAGAGGIGCAVGHALSAAGAAVTFVDTDPAKVRWGQTHGVAVDRIAAQKARFIHFDDWRPAAGSTVLLCTKCYDNPFVLARLPASVRLIPIQNGFDRSLEAQGVGLEGIASFVSECIPGQTHTRISRAGRLHLGGRASGDNLRGSTNGGGYDCLDAGFLNQLRRHARFRVQSVRDILPYKYTKLMYNAAISPLAAAAGLDNGQLLSVPRARALFFGLIRENYAILRAARVPLARIGPFHPDTVNYILRRLPLAGLLAWVFYPTLRKTYCSMSGDLPRGRTEIEYYNRHLIDLAEDFPCPLNRQVYALVKRMERERLPPGLHVLDELG
jgi:2-dehydropantoate 2-reductase